MRYLTTEEQQDWRKEYQQKEDEVQKNIAVYLSALVVVVGWVFSPQAKPVIQTAIGNDGWNVTGILILVAVNAAFTCFLVYKSIQIHEITQFVTAFSPTDTVSQYWEHWRRSKQSLSRKWKTRVFYMVAIGSIPAWTSVVALGLTWHIIHQNRAQLAAELLRTQTPIPSPPSTANTQAPSQQPPAPVMQKPPQAMVERIDNSLWWAYRIWWVVAGIHLLPALFLFVSARVSSSKWEELHHLLGLPSFDNLRELRASLQASDSPKGPTAPAEITVVSGTIEELTVMRVSSDLADAPPK